MLGILIGMGTGVEAQTRAPARRIVARVEEARRTVLPGNTHRLARQARLLSPAPAELPMDRMLLVLRGSTEQERELTSLLEDLHDPTSVYYHQWLSPDEFGRRFGPADDDIRTVTSWLASRGFSVDNIAKGRTAIEFSGTAQQVEQAFHTAIRRVSVNGEEHWANITDPPFHPP